jgi:ankyrin repeat protein
MPVAITRTLRTFVIGIASVLTLAFSTQAISAPPDPVQARKDLKAMGLEYNGQEFAKAAGNGDMTSVKLFLDAGMDINEGGGSALGLAAGRGKLEMVKFLLSKGAKPTANSLQFSRTRGHTEIEKLLIEHGAKE